MVKSHACLKLKMELLLKDNVNFGKNKYFLKLIKTNFFLFKVFIRRIPMSSIPIHDEKLNAEFLQQLYREKDEIFDVFDKYGDFSSLGVKKHTLKKNRNDMYITIFWLLVILIPSIYYFLIWFWSGTLAFKLGLSTFIAIGRIDLLFN